MGYFAGDVEMSRLRYDGIKEWFVRTDAALQARRLIPLDVTVAIYT